MKSHRQYFSLLLILFVYLSVFLKNFSAESYNIYSRKNLFSVQSFSKSNQIESRGNKKNWRNLNSITAFISKIKKSTKHNIKIKPKHFCGEKFDFLNTSYQSTIPINRDENFLSLQCTPLRI